MVLKGSWDYPMQYLKDLRLEQVRTKLVRGDIHTSVTTAAMACGFKQLGWFANQYKEKYGETPSETLRRGTSKESFFKCAAKYKNN